MNAEEIESYRLNSTEKINKAISDNNLKLNIDNQFLDPPLFYYSYDKKTILSFLKN